jgi:hypothetical protein
MGYGSAEGGPSSKASPHRAAGSNRFGFKGFRIQEPRQKKFAPFSKPYQRFNILSHGKVKVALSRLAC